MRSNPLTSALQYLRYLPLWSALTATRWRSFDARARGLGTTFAIVMRFFPMAWQRFDREILRVFPDMDRRARAALGQEMGRQMGRTLYEIYHDAEFQTQQSKFNVSGPGLDALKAAQAEGKGALILSGHFGQWEAIRAAIKMHGMVSGAVYRRNKNRHYERRIATAIQAGGTPVLATGSTGTRALVKHLRDGGIMSILLDEKQADGVMLPFLGHDAMTSIAAAQLALKYGVPMIPCYGIRAGDGTRFDVIFEDPIPHSDAITMTRAFNDSISKRIMANPEQWYWLLRRWDSI